MIALAAFLVALVPGVLVPLKLRDVYMATSIVTLQGTPAVLGFGLDYEGPAGSASALILSDRVLGRVVGREFPGGDDTSQSAPDPGVLRRWMQRVGIGESALAVSPEVQRRQQINGLRGSLYVELPRGSRDVQVSYRSFDPGDAAYFANAVADAFVEQQEDQRQQALRRAIRFLSQKASEIRDRIRRREEGLSQLVAAGAVQPEGAGARADRERDRLGTSLREAKMELLLLDQRLAQLRPLVGEPGLGSQNPEHELILKRLSEVRSRLDALRLQYTSTHPEVVRLEQMRSDLASQIGGEEESVTLVDPSRVQEFNRLKAQRDAVSARVVVVQRALKDTTRPEDAEAVTEYDRLSRELEIDRQMLQVVLQRMNETAMNAGGPMDAARVLEYAVRPLRPYAPDRLKVHGMGLGAALAFGIGLAVLLELLDRRVYDPEEAARLLGTSFLGNIPLVLDGTDPGQQSALLYASPAGESYRNLRTSLLFATGGSRLRSLLVTSAAAGEGKTTTTSNLAASFSNVGRSVLLIDADMRRPRIDHTLALPRSPGLSDVLQGTAKLEEVVQHLDETRLDVVTSGASPGNPTELLSSPAFDLMFSRARKIYDLVLIDAPILLAVADALLLSARVDGVLLVHKPGSVDRTAFVRMAADLRRMDANVLGLVFNQVDVRDPYQYPAYMRSPYISGSKRTSRWRRWRRGEEASEGDASRGKKS